MSNTGIYTWQNHEADIELAKRLQEQFNHEANVEKPLGNIVYDQKKKINPSKSLVDPSWELVDPTPDIYNLFIVFNDQFFWGKLGAVSVKWSKRMTSCAGICSYNYRGGMCAIALSEPLLKLRPRKDLVETLLHEMIHALLFVTHNNKDRDGHGPEFHKHMYRINAEAGTNITVYHTFHDEVRLYQQHWWKCNGPCQHRKPYFGMVKRATNRAPGPNDFWWGEHSRSCGGTFIKIKEPEKPDKKKKSNKENKKPVPEILSKPKNDIRNYISGTSSSSTSKATSSNNPIITINDLNSPKIAVNKSNDSNTKNSSNKTSSTVTSSSYNGKNTINGFHNINNLQNTTNKNCDKNDDIKGFHNIDEPSTKKPIEVFSGTGNILSKSPVKSNSYDAVRTAWVKKLNDSLKAKNKRPSINKSLSPAKKICIEDEILKENKILVKCPVCNTSIEDKKLNSHLDTCLENNQQELEEEDACPICNRNFPISDLERHTNACLDDGDDDLNLSPIKTDSFKNNSDSPQKKKCDICGINQLEENYNEHLANCLIIFCGKIQDMAGSSNLKKNEESIYLDSDEEDSFINDNSLIEDYNKTKYSKRNDDKNEMGTRNKAEELIYLDSDVEDSFIKDNSLIEDYNKLKNSSKEVDKSEVYFDTDEEEQFLNDNSLIDDYNKSFNNSFKGDSIILDD